MKVLLDEDLPHKLYSSIVNHEVFTTAYMGWSGLKNGELLRTADGAGFEIFVTGDKNLSDQQNLKKYNFAVIVLSTQDWTVLRHHLNKISLAIDAAQPGSLQRIQCG